MPEEVQTHRQSLQHLILWVDDDPEVFSAARRLVSLYKIEYDRVPAVHHLLGGPFIDYISRKRSPFIIFVSGHSPPKVEEYQAVFRQLPITGVISDLEIGGDPFAGILVLSVAASSPLRPQMALFSGRINESARRLATAVGVKNLISKKEFKRIEKLLFNWLDIADQEERMRRTSLSQAIERLQQENNILKRERSRLKKDIRALTEKSKPSKKGAVTSEEELIRLKGERDNLEREMKMILAHHHDLTNTSAFTVQALEQICSDPRLLPPIIVAELERVRVSAKHCSILVNTLTTLTMKAEPSRVKPSSVENAVQEAFQIIKRKIPENINVVFDIRTRLPLCGIPDHLLVRCLLNLLLNSLEAMPQGGQIKIAVTPPRNRSKFIQMTIHDNGNGIKKLHLPKVFNPDFSTKGKSQGFGLFIVKKVMEEFGGAFVLDSIRGKGTKVILKIPVA